MGGGGGGAGTKGGDWSGDPAMFESMDLIFALLFFGGGFGTDGGDASLSASGSSHISWVVPLERSNVRDSLSTNRILSLSL